MDAIQRSPWLLLLLASTLPCTRSASEKVAVVLQGDSTGTRFVQQMVERNPQVADPHSKKEFFIQVVRPDPKADYKIVQVQPDPKVKYYLRVLSPEGKGTDAAMNGRLSSALQARAVTELATRLADPSWSRHEPANRIGPCPSLTSRL